MEAEIKKDRSPKSPKLSLEDSIDKVRRVYQKAGKAGIKNHVVAEALGYAGLTGSSLTAIATLKQYGLLEINGEALSVSALALRLLHPLNSGQELKSRRESALLPPVFAALHSGGFHVASEDVLANHLIHSRFSPDSARIVAAVFKQNVEFAKLDEESNISAGEELFSSSVRQAEKTVQVATKEETTRHSSVLASYSVPLGENEATLTFRGGENLTSDHFDALSDYVELFKKQFLRKQKDQQAEAGL